MTAHKPGQLNTGTAGATSTSPVPQATPQPGDRLPRAGRTLPRHDGGGPVRTHVTSAADTTGHAAIRAGTPSASAAGLAGQQRKKVRNLSGGQKRRLDLALSLIGHPDLLFLDEPTTGFDPNARRDAWEVVRNLRGAGSTIMLTTHYMDEAQALADQVAVISDGQIVAEGTLATIGGRDTAAHPLARDRAGTRARRGQFLRTRRRGRLPDPQRRGRAELDFRRLTGAAVQPGPTRPVRPAHRVQLEQPRCPGRLGSRRRVHRHPPFPLEPKTTMTAATYPEVRNVPTPAPMPTR